MLNFFLCFRSELATEVILHGTFSLMVLQGNCARGRTGHMIIIINNNYLLICIAQISIQRRDFHLRITLTQQNPKSLIILILDLLLEFRERIEYKFSDLRSGSSEMGHTLLANRGIKEEKPNCWIHPNHHGHPIWRCKAFENKSAEEKIKLV